MDDMDLRIRKAQRALVVAQRSKLFFDAFMESGHMEATNAAGDRMVGRVYTNVNRRQLVRNAQREAERLAAWSVEDATTSLGEPYA